MIRSIPVILLTSIFLTLGTMAGSAASEDPIDSALPVAQAWVAEIDAGHYDDSYLAAGSALHEKVHQDQWSQVLKALRPVWGNVVSRKVVNHLYKPNGFEGKSGEFMVITYNTTFKKLDLGIEVVVLQLENGQWRGVGYNAGIKPKPQDEQAQQPAQSQTDVQTTTLPAGN